MPNEKQRDPATSGIFVAKGPIDISSDFSRVDDQIQAEALAAAREEAGKQFPVVGGLRYSHGRVFNRNRYSIRSYVSEREGSGFWEIFRLSEHLVVLISDCTYRQPKWLAAADDGYMKIRLLRSGTLLTQQGEDYLRGPGGMLAFYPSRGHNGYFVREQTRCRLVVLLWTTSVFADELGIDPDTAALDTATPNLRKVSSQLLELTPRLNNCLGDILDSRDVYSINVRPWFIEAKAKEITSSVIQDLLQEPELMIAANRIRRRDQNRILEAKEIINSSLSNLPTIVRLASMLGLNQTKLKAGFKAMFGCTVGEYIKQQKMEQAAQMLRSSGALISEISRAVGYRHQANFSHAFKEYYGCLPKDMRRRESTDY